MTPPSYTQAPKERPYTHRKVNLVGGMVWMLLNVTYSLRPLCLELSQLKLDKAPTHKLQYQENNIKTERTKLIGQMNKQMIYICFCTLLSEKNFFNNVSNPMSSIGLERYASKY